MFTVQPLQVYGKAISVNALKMQMFEFGPANIVGRIQNLVASAA